MIIPKKILTLVILSVVMIVCIVANFNSCADAKSKMLTGGSYQYWHYIDSKLNEKTKLPYCCREDSFLFYLNCKGTYIEFDGISERFREFFSFFYLHYTYEPTWELLENNIVRFGRYRYKILSISKNRILMHDEGKPMAVDTLELFPKTNVPKEYRDFQKPFHFIEIEEHKKQGLPFFIL